MKEPGRCALNVSGVGRRKNYSSLNFLFFPLFKLSLDFVSKELCYITDRGKRVLKGFWKTVPADEGAKRRIRYSFKSAIQTFMILQTIRPKTIRMNNITEMNS